MTAGNVLLARQPICDGRSQCVAYEILYRSAGVRDRAAVLDDDVATAKVSVNAILEIGLDTLVGGGRAFVNVGRGLLLQKLYDFLPPERVVLELLEDVEPDAEVLAAVDRAKARGYTIALDDFCGEEHKGELVARADLIKLDFPSIAPADLARIVRELARPKLRLLAEKVETQADFARCQGAGFDLFQGYFFARPELVTGRRMPADRLSLVRLMASVQDDRADIDDIERLIATNVALSYRLLRYVNSALFAVPTRIESIRHAVLMLGLERVRTCVLMLVLAGLDDKPHELVVTALMRARFCELLAKLGRAGEGHKFFTVGLLSVLDAFMERPFEELVAELNFAPDVEAALLRHEGELGRTLAAAIACERGDWDALLATGLDATALREAYVESLRWVSQSDAALSQSKRT